MKRIDLDGLNLVHLISQECGPDAARGLNPERGGVICDPCPGHEERNPSFSVYRRGNRWLWKRHGGDGMGGDAYSFLLRMGYAPAQAWDALARFQGIRASGWEFITPNPRHTPDPLQEALRTLEKCRPLDKEELKKLTLLTSPLRSASPAERDLHRRGLCGWPGLEVLTLRHDFRTRKGKLLAHAGSLAFLLRGPDGQVWGVKVRNLGSKEALEARHMQRYVYRIASHGAPAWCSPAYGQGEAVLIVEGELNGAAASRALTESGLKVDVQGLAGANGTPFIHGLHGKPVYLYADPDAAGQNCLERVNQLSRSAGACAVNVLNSSDKDFCDLLGTLGTSTFLGILKHRIETSEPWQEWRIKIGGNNDLPVNNAVRQTKNDYWHTSYLSQEWSRSSDSGWGAADRGGWCICWPIRHSPLELSGTQ